MPELSRFFGIEICMYYADHGPPQFHARYGNERASIRIDNGERLDGGLGRRALRLVKDVEAFKRFSIVLHTLAWPGGADFAPESLRERLAITV